MTGAAVTALAGLVAATGGELDEYDVTPGLLGFLVTFALVAVCIPLFISMTGKIRRLRRDDDADRPAPRRGPDADDGRGQPGGS